MATATIWGCLSFHIDCVFHILQEVGVELRGPFKARLPHMFVFKIYLCWFGDLNQLTLNYAEVINTKHSELTFYLTKCNTLLRRMLYLPQARRPPALPVVELSSCPPASEPHTISISLDLNSFSNLKLVKEWQESIWKTQYQNINILVITLKLTCLGYS